MKGGIFMSTCKICNKRDAIVYTNINYKMTPICLDCYMKSRMAAKNKYKKLMNKLSSKGYVWVLNIGEDETFPYTFFGLGISFFQIVQYFFRYIDYDNFYLQNQDDCVFLFEDYPDPIVTETCITFIDNTGRSYSVGIKMGKYDEVKKELLFFTDKQIGLKKSDLSNYASYVIDDCGLTRVVPDNDCNNYWDENDLYSIDDSLAEKDYLDQNDLENLIGYVPYV